MVAFQGIGVAQDEGGLNTVFFPFELFTKCGAKFD
jgi:hypothetical protein